MPPYEIPDKIDEAFVQGLVDRKQPENMHFEFKQQLGDITAAQTKRRLVERASALANEEGGFLIYGIREGENEDKGKAVEITGINCPQNDDVIRNAIENVIRSWVNPALVGVDVLVISMNSEKRVLVLNVPKRKSLPHQVIKGGPKRIYRRHSGGIYEPDVEELAQLFSRSTATTVGSKNITNLVNHFREKRFEAIRSNDTPVVVKPGPRLVLHVIPACTIIAEQDLDLNSIRDVVYPKYWYCEFTSDGLSLNQDCRWGYLQILRNGSVEYVERDLAGGSEKAIPSILYEQVLRDEVLPDTFKLFHDLGLELPWYVALSFLDVQGTEMGLGHNETWNARIMLSALSLKEKIRQYNKENLILPAVRVDTPNPDIDELMQPVFDRVWQAFGFPRSCNYNNEGKWRHS